jgi:hypothetical protein
MKKSLLLFASVAAFSSAALAQGIVADASAIDIASATAGTVIGSNDAITLSIATPDTYKSGATKVDPYTTFVINNEEFSASYGITGTNNPADADGKAPNKSLSAPVSGAAFKVDANKDGYVVAWAKLTGNKQYTVFEDGAAISYRLVMYPDELIDITVDDVTTTIQAPATIAGSSATGNGMGVIVFPVSEGKSYIVNGNGSKISLGGVYYNADANISVSIKGKDAEQTLIEAQAANTVNVQEYTINPVGDTVSVLSPITITFPNVTSIEEDLSVWDYVSVSTQTRMGMSECYTETEIDGNKLIITIDEMDLNSGSTYVLNVPAGLYKLDGTPNEAICDTFVYEVTTADYAISVTPENGSTVSSLNEVKVEVESTGVVTFDYATQYFTLLGDEDVYFGNASAEGNCLTITFADEIPAGDYVLYVPGAAILVDGVALTETLAYVFTLNNTTGISSVVAADNKGGISYDLRGVKVNAATRGIIVKDGKKVQLR